MGIVVDLLAHPGVYLGIDNDAQGRGSAAARIVVTPLPGGAGVTLDYETFTPDNPERVRGHAEHLPGAGKTTLARSLEAEYGAVRLCPDEWMADLGVDLFDEAVRARVEQLQMAARPTPSAPRCGRGDRVGDLGP